MKRVGTNFKRVIAFSLIICMVVSVIGFNGLIVQSYAAVGDTYQIEGTDSNNPVSLTDGGFLKTFTVNGGNNLILKESYSQADTFTVDIAVPNEMINGVMADISLFLMPAASDDLSEEFVKNYRLENKATENNLHRIWYSTQTTTSESDSDITEFTTDSAFFDWHEYMYVDDNWNEVIAMDGDLPPTGKYFPVCVFYESNVTSYSSGETIPATFIIGAKPIYVQNSVPVNSDAGSSYIPDEQDDVDMGVYLDVDVYAGDEELKYVKTLVYCGDVCYGYAPCRASVGDEITLSITPVGANNAYRYKYIFPSREYGNELKVTVPEDGHIEVDLQPFVDCTISGYVYDINKKPVAGAVVSAALNDYADTSFSAYTDSEGYYIIEDCIGAGGICLTASKEGCYTSEYMIPASEVTDGAELSHDFTLDYKTDAFKICFTGDADSEIKYQAALRCLDTEWVAVKDGSGEEISGEFKLKDADLIAFYPDKEPGGSGKYTLDIKSNLVQEDTVDVSYGKQADLTLNNLAAIIITPTIDPLGIYTHFTGFGTDGETIYNYNGYDGEIFAMFPIEGNEEVIRLIGYTSEIHSGFMVSNINEIPTAILSDCYDEKITLNSGKVTVLEGITIPHRIGISEYLDLSYFSADSQVTDEGDTISVSGHIDSSQGDIKITALRIYGWSEASSDYYALLTAVYKDNSLVIDGAPAEATLTESGDFIDINRKLTLANTYEGPIDFACKLETKVASDMKIVVQADFIMDGTEYTSELVGTSSVSGVPVSIKTSARSASGTVKCSGIAKANKLVEVWCGSSLLGSAMADKYGMWELCVHLPIGVIDSTSYRIHATCSGYSTGDCIIMYDREAAAAEEIYLVSEGEVQSDVYVWNDNATYGFEAVVSNPSAVRENAEFYVMCSDGSVISLDAMQGEMLSPENGVSRQIFYSREFEFGNKGLMPVKVWFTYSAAKDVTDLTYKASVNAGAVTDPDSYDFNSISARSYDRMITDEEIGEGLAITTAMSEVEKEQFDSLNADTAEHIVLYDDDGEEAYDILIKTDDALMYTIGVYAADEDKYYTFDTYISETKDYGPIKQDLSATIKRAKERGLKTIVTTTVYKENGVDPGKVINDTNDVAGIVSLLLDPTGQTDLTIDAGIKKLLESSPKTAKFAGITKYVGVSDLITICDTLGNAGELFQKSSLAAENMKFLNFIDKYEGLLAGDVDMTRAVNSAGVARRELNSALEQQTDYLAVSMELAIVDFVIDKTTGALGKSVNFALGPIKDAMMEAIKGCGSDATWSFANECFIEAKLQFLKSTNISHDRLMEIFRAAEEGNYTDAAILKMLKDSMKDGEDEQEEDSEETPEDDDGNAISEDSEDFTPIIDPSGYVYEAVASNRVEGAVVTLYSEGMEAFKADAYGQTNPLISDSEGRYSWDVPEGNWFVKAYLRGYEEGSSANDPAATVQIGGVNYLPVLPPQLDVNIPLTSEYRPVGTICSSGEELYLVFNKYVMIDTVTSDSITISGVKTGNCVFTPVDSETSPAHTPICGGMELATTFRINTSKAIDESDYSLMVANIADTVKGYNNMSVKPTAYYDASATPGKTGGRTDVKDTGSAFPFIPVIPIVAGVGTAGGVTAAILIRRKKKAAK